MRKIISYSLYGNNPRYSVNAIINAEICKELYPDWQCVMYHDNSVPHKVIEKLKLLSNVILLDMSNKPYQHFPTRHSPKMFWRFMAYENPEIDVVIFRDSDSFPSIRERDAVLQWIDSGKSIHLMRDHPHHRSKIMGGMWGLRKNNKVESLIAEILKKEKQAFDQYYLTLAIYPLFEDDRVVHDDSNYLGDKTHDWPTPKEHPEIFIGRPQGPPDPSLFPEQAARHHQLIKETS